jgi:hypothetical protein
MEPDKTNQKRERQLTREQRVKASTVAEEDIARVYEHWLLVMRPNRKGRRPALDDRRRLKVAAAIHDYGVTQCLTAIDGCARSDFHMGRNRLGKRYDDLELIFRDQDHVERFLVLGEEERGGW